LAVTVTLDPDTYHGPGGFADTVPVPAGNTAVVNWYCVCHCHVIVEFPVIVNVVVVPLPLAGTFPVPTQPVHTYLTPVWPATGDAAEHVTTVPLAYDVTPYAGTGVPGCTGCPETVSVYGTAWKFDTIDSGPFIVSVSGLLIELNPPDQ